MPEPFQGPRWAVARILLQQIEYEVESQEGPFNHLLIDYPKLASRVLAAIEEESPTNE